MSLPVENDTGTLFTDAPPTPLRRRGEIHIGTSGYSFRDWQGAFYPDRLPRGQWLEYYAIHFPVVEINATYYRIPPPSTFESMARRTPERFGFWVKLPGQATHQEDYPQVIMNSFNDAVQPLSDAGRLRGALAQFPYSFRPDEKAFEKISRLQDLLDGVPLAVEFRREEWLSDRTFAFLSERKLVFVTVDAPPLPGLPPPVVRVTGPVAYARFHGRNERTWFHSERGDRYDYEYNTSELTEWMPHIARMDEEAAATYLFFNNCHAGQAVKNARMLRQMLGDPNLTPRFNDF